MMDYVVAQVLASVFYVIGMILKNTDKIKDWCIPWILLVWVCYILNRT